MSTLDSDSCAQGLDDLLRSRFHGAANIGGIRYQLLYSLFRTLELYRDSAPGEVQFEGLEDVDLRGLSVGNVYYQVKSSRSRKGWSWFERERILDRFIQAYLVDRSSRFVLVANFRFTDELERLASLRNGQLDGLPKSTRTKLSVIARRTGLPKSEITEVLRRVSFEHITESQLLAELRAALVRSFGLSAGNEELYLRHLFACVAGWASGRDVITRRHLEAEKLRVDEWIGLGRENPAVRDRLIQPLTYAQEDMSEDYYEGKKARPGHIQATLDAPRPQWQQEIEKTLGRVKVCIIRASSGQGKSTLLYRYAFDHFSPDTVYRLRVCAEDEHVGPVADYLRNRLALGLPLLVLVDNLGYSARLWHKLAAELAGESIRFLISTREEDWYRYGLETSGFVWDFVEPGLSLDEARTVFQYFFGRGKVAASVPSAEWAYEQVADKRLLIEFVYLITHGQMLAERIQEQIRTIEERGEDPAKLDVLRLVATAQVYGARVSVQSLLSDVDFRADPQSTLKALEGEYIECYNGECEGLHFVRSDHIVQALHDPLPLAHTLARLVRVLDQANLVALVSSALADPAVELDTVLSALVQRCQSGPLSFVIAIADAVFMASESMYFQTHRHLFDAAVERLGTSSLLLLTSATLPSGDIDLLGSLEGSFPGHPNIRLLKELISQFLPRDEIRAGSLPGRFLEGVLPNVRCYEPLADVASLSTYCKFFKVSARGLDEFFGSRRWEDALYQAAGESVSLFLHALYHRLPDRYRRFLRANKGRLFGQFKLSFDTLAIQEENGDVSIQFIVDEGEQAKDPAEQAASRLEQLRRWFPLYGNYGSEGLYPSLAEAPVGFDPSQKKVPGDTLDLSLHAVWNSKYVRLVKEAYAPRLAVDWAQHWYRLRKGTLEFARTLVSVYEMTCRGGQVHTGQLPSSVRELGRLYRERFELPARLASRFDGEQRVIRDWASSMQNFVEQYLQHVRGDSDERKSFLMRHNLRDGLRKLPLMHQAFADILRAEVDHFGLAELNRYESEVYPYLADILDYWMEPHRRLAGNLRPDIRRWREAQRLSAETRVRECLAPLEQAGMEFLFPAGLLQEHPLTGLCIGYDVIDFEQHAEQLDLIGGAIATLDLAYDYLYLVPTIGRHRCGLPIIRVRRDILQRLAAGQEEQGGVYPVPPPAGLWTVLPDLDAAPLPETSFIERLGVIQVGLMMERNKLHFAQSKLDPNVAEEAALYRRYESRAGRRADELLGAFGELQKDALEYRDTGEASQEWLDLWEEGSAFVQHLADLSDVSPSYVPQAVLQQSSVDRLFFRYMNRRYLAS